MELRMYEQVMPSATDRKYSIVSRSLSALVGDTEGTPNAALEVVSGVHHRDTVLVSSFDSSKPQSAVRVADDEDSDLFAVQSDGKTPGEVNMFVNGRVGVNTPSPRAALHVNGGLQIGGPGMG